MAANRMPPKRISKKKAESEVERFYAKFESLCEFAKDDSREWAEIMDRYEAYLASLVYVGDPVMTQIMSHPGYLELVENFESMISSHPGVDPARIYKASWSIYTNIERSAFSARRYLSRPDRIVVIRNLNNHPMFSFWMDLLSPEFEAVIKDSISYSADKTFRRSIFIITTNPENSWERLDEEVMPFLASHGVNPEKWWVTHPRYFKEYFEPIIQQGDYLAVASLAMRVHAVAGLRPDDRIPHLMDGLLGILPP